MNRLSKKLYTLSGILLLSLILLSLLFAWILCTESGTRSLFFGLQTFFNCQIKASTIKGKLINNIEIKNLELNSNKFQIKTEELIISINVLKLLNQTLDLSSLIIKQGFFKFGSAENAPYSIEEDPATLIIHQATIHNLYYSKQGQFKITVNEFKGLLKEKPLQAQGRLEIGSNMIDSDKTEADLESSSKNHFELNWDQHVFRITNSDSDQKTFTSAKILNWFLKIQANPQDKFEFQGSMINQALTTLEGELQSLSIKSQAIGTWILRKPSKLFYNKERFSIDKLIFLNAKHNTEAIFEASRSRVQEFMVSFHCPVLPLKTPYFSSQAELHIDLKQKKHFLIGTGTLKLKPGNLMLKLPGNKYYRTQHLGGEGQLNLTEKQNDLSFEFKESAENIIKGTLYFPELALNRPLKQQILQGKIIGKFENLSIFYHLVPALSRIKGNAVVEANIKGSLSSPKAQVSAEIPDAIFSIPKQHITFKNFYLNLKGELPGKINLVNTGTLGGEPYSLTGFFELFTPTPHNEFELKGKNLRIYNTPTINIHASPDLKLMVKKRQLFVEGILTIPEANIILKDELKNIMTSNDVVFIDQHQNQTLMETLKIVPKLKLIVENKVHYKGNNLDATLEGRIRVEQRQDKLLTALGRLTIVEGKYRLQNGPGYIHRGRLAYPPGTLLKDPVLDIRISRKRNAQIEDNTEVGIYVQGTLKKPMVHLYSNNNLQSAEILSRLGFSSSQLDGNDNQKHILSQTALFLAGSNPVFDKLEIDEFGLQNKDFFKSSPFSTLGNPMGAQDSVLVVGKSFGKKLYLQYLQGMGESSSGLRLKYFLTPQFAIGVEKDTEGMGADLSFSVERN